MTFQVSRYVWDHIPTHHTHPFQQRSSIMASQSTHESDSLEPSSDKPRKPYHPPRLIPFETGEIEGGNQNLQEADGTGFFS